MNTLYPLYPFDVDCNINVNGFYVTINAEFILPLHSREEIIKRFIETLDTAVEPLRKAAEEHGEKSKEWLDKFCAELRGTVAEVTE